ncbi:dnaJ-like protein subfamily C member 2 [Gossypium australe]|uniref:DnaJ-like protein subfamily C member 2 n=1 Tax=Gossypium australe TaxID=47621 RepID=A0A5B6WEP2_9ROSI|nr:dnaJ-like protein subfamily C member 2 [Gossypium australe]
MSTLAPPSLIPSNRKCSKPDKIDEPIRNHGDLAEKGNGVEEKRRSGSNFDKEGKEWSEAEIEIEILKKQMVKTLMGKPDRWETIASAFKGKYKIDSMIKKRKGIR